MIVSSHTMKCFVGLAVVRLAYPKGQLRPYIFGGLGGHHSSQQLSAHPVAGVTWANGGTEERMLVDRRKTAPALGFGIGLDLFPTDSFFIGTELRAIWLAGLNTDDSAALRAEGFRSDRSEGTTQSYFLMRLGWAFK